MRQVFKADPHERRFREDGYVVVDLLTEAAIVDLLAFYSEAFAKKREVVAYARNLPYYISIFDCDSAHKRDADARISGHVQPRLPDLMLDYEVFYSNFMIKFPGDGQIEAHQDFNFVDESRHTAFNLWCPLVDTDPANGGLFVIPGSHNVFRTQRGPNIPRALTQYNDRLKRYARLVPLQKGQAAIFDHKLIHYSPPNTKAHARVAVQSDADAGRGRRHPLRVRPADGPGEGPPDRQKPSSRTTCGTPTSRIGRSITRRTSSRSPRKAR
jgi:ectoine hydroxylase-related dioxygenase (phytanoyl-CoA dioxygenase family)